MRTIVSLFLLGVTILSAGYITPPLQAVLDTLSPGNKTWVSVHLKERPNLARFPQRAYAEKIAYLREFSQRTQQPFIDFANSFGNQIDSLKSFWVYNGFCLKATKPVILAIASKPQVDFVNGGEARGIEQGPSGYAPPPLEREWNIERVGAHWVWLRGYTGQGIVVCIFDSGMLINHESYAGKWRYIINNEPHWEYAWKDAYDPQQSTPVDYSGHGTHVGGIAIGGDGWSGPLRDIGVAPGAKLIACTPRYDYSNLRHACFQWIAELANTPYGNLAPDVVNCSWGNPFNNEDLEYWNDVLTLRALDIIPVFCIGNVVSWDNWPPGNFPTTIGVGATDVHDNWAMSFSGHGPSPTNSPWNEQKYWSRPDWEYMGVDLVAPGTKEGTTEGIYSADRNDPHGYIWMWGTSQATPHITGAIALMQEAALDNFGHKLDYYDIYNILIDAADPVGESVPNYYYGWGRLDCKSAVDSVINFRLKSSSPKALANNNQRKLVYDQTNQIIHMVYQSAQTFERSGKYIRYTYSTDFGQTWSIEEKVGDGEAPTITLDGDGNLHCLYRDGNALMYVRFSNGIPEPPLTLFIDLFAIDIGVPVFTIAGNTGYVAFELYNQWMQSQLMVGTFDITSVNPELQYSSLESSSNYRFGAPAITIDPNSGVVVSYTREISGVREVYYRASAQNWQLILVSRNDGVKSCSPVVISADGLWFFWEDGEPADIYYRQRRNNNWVNRPSPVYVSASAYSLSPRVAVNSLEPSRLYVSWVEQVSETYDIFATAYYNGWQEPINISNSAVESRDPDVVHIPGNMIEGWLMVNYIEGNDAWINRGKYLPLYRLRTYQTMLPLAGGGPQDRNTMPIGSLEPTLEIYPNPFKNHLMIKFQIPNHNNQTNFNYQIPNNSEIRNSQSEIEFSLSTRYSLLATLRIYEATGRLVKSFLLPTSYFLLPTSLEWDGCDDSGRRLPAGVYFVRLDLGDFKQVEKAILLR